ncbi:MAG: 16S rRNA (uracil(1498)-N(3))-methyltransferase [Thermoanaerobaculia bacterium]|nr:16S rRNA (uracil(1498)-N(3))-methyltransferase [Thermoanaerobaculia bacterium]
MHHRIFTDQPIAPGEITIAGEEFHHASRVVRVRDGEAVEVFDGRGGSAAGRVKSIASSSMSVIIESTIPSRESPLSLTLAMSIINLEKFEIVLQKATELGVVAFIPMVTERVELRPERYRGKSERWEKIVFEAVKQSGRAVTPRIEVPTPFNDVIRRDGTRLLFDADSQPSLEEPVNTATLLIGPEGGWSEEEIASARASSCLFRRLGPRRLRAETAAICAVAIITARYGDI